LVSQLGQGCILTVYIFRGPTGRMQREVLSPTKFSKYNYALRGGAKQSALYMYFAIEQITFVNPLFYKRTD
jgi:hypothetical protein